MASFVINNGSTQARNLGIGDIGFIGQNGALFYEGVGAITSVFSTELVVLGSLVSDSEVIYHEKGTFNLNVGPSGFIGDLEASPLPAIYVEDTSRGLINNSGTISTHATAIQLNGYVYSEFTEAQGHVVTNSGKIISSLGSAISALGNNLGADSEEVYLNLTNTGEITGYSGISTTGRADITNAGTIIGMGYAAFYSDGEDAEDTIINTGSMIGMIEMGGGDDRLINRGSVDEVSLGEGDDFYNARNGGMSGDITAGDGNDTLRGGREDDTFRGNAGDDELRGRSGDDWLLGGDGDDSIAGQKGDDFMNGGKGADVFIFASNGGFDTIAKLQSNDTIDLTALGLNRFGKDIKPHIEDAKGGSRIDLTDDFDLSIFVRGSDPDDLKASDFLL